MGLILTVLAFYAIGCMAFTAVMMWQNFDVIMDVMPPGLRYEHAMLGLCLVILTSPISVTVVEVKVIYRAWREIMDRCQ